MIHLRNALTALVFLLPSAAFASGQLIIQPGEPVMISGETTLVDPSTTWTITQAGTVINTLSTPEFEHAFFEPGDYQVTLLVVDAAGNTEESHLDILVGASANEQLPLKAVFHSLPAANTAGIVQLDAEKPQVILHAAESAGDIVEYRFDKNIAVDSDGDGDPANDIDNQADASLYTGSPWGISFSSLATTITARLTVVDEEGSTDSSDITFQAKPAANPAAPLVANIATVPSITQGGEMLLVGDSAEAVLFFGDSTGDIIQYRFDKNIAVDSDGDGDPANDIDNKNHPSFLTGEPHQVTLRKADGDTQIFQLIVVSDEGKGSRIRRKVVFTEPEPLPVPEGPIILSPKLFLDHDQAVVGETVTMHVFGAPQNTRISWDFQNDGEIDASGERAFAKYAYETAGDFRPTVTLVLDEQVTTVSEDIRVVSAPESAPTTALPTADFSHIIEGGTLRLTDLSSADPRLEDDSLVYLWSFGDGETSNEAAPTYTYDEVGSYTVALEVTDSAGNKTKKAIEIAIAEVGSASIETPNESPGAAESPATSPTETEPVSTETPATSPVATPMPTDRGSLLGGIFKFILFLLLFLILLLGGYFVFRKIHDPDRSFGEIIDDEVKRFSGSHTIAAENDQASPFVVASSPKENSSAEDATIIEKQASKIPGTAPPPTEAAPSPFLQAQRTEDNQKTEPDTAPKVLQNEEGTRSNIKAEMPDWLREDTSKPPASKEQASPPPDQKPATPEPEPVQNPHRKAPTGDVQQKPATPPPQSPESPSAQNTPSALPPQNPTPPPTPSAPPPASPPPAPQQEEPAPPAQQPTPQPPKSSPPMAHPTTAVQPQSAPAQKPPVAPPAPPPAPPAQQPNPPTPPPPQVTSKETHDKIAGEADLPLRPQNPDEKKSQ